MKEQEKLATEQYFSDTRGGAPTGPGGGKGGGKGRDWGKTMHKMATGLDKFMKLTNTTWKNMWDVMPDRIQNPIDKAFKGLPGNIKEGLTTGVETAWNHYLDTGKLQEALAMGAAEGIRTATAQSGEFTQAAGNIVAGVFEGKSWRKGLGEEMTKSMNTKGGYLNNQLESLNASAAENEKSNLAMIADAKSQINMQKAGAAFYKKHGNDKKAEEMAKKAGKLSSDMQKDALKSGLKQGAAAGGASALTAGIGVLASGGSLKDAGKSALISGAGTATSVGVTAALSATPLAPIAPLLGSLAGGLVSGGLGKLFGGGRKKPLSGAASRAKILGGLTGALRMAKSPGGEQLYEAFKTGGRLNKMAKKEIDASMMNSSGKMDEGLRGELISSVGSAITRSTGIQLTSDEVLTFLAAIKGTGMQGHEQKSLLTQFERRFEGVGARGAIVNRPTVALIGEAGPEAVTPLDQTRGNSPLASGGGGDLAGEIRQMNQLLAKYVSNPPAINIDGQRVSRVINAANSDDIRTGVSTVNSRV